MEFEEKAAVIFFKITFQNSIGSTTRVYPKLFGLSR